MITPNRFVELESIESKKILLVNDPSHEKINNLKFHDIIIFCETLHPLLDENIEMKRVVGLKTKQQLTEWFND